MPRPIIDRLDDLDVIVRHLRIDIEQHRDRIERLERNSNIVQAVFSWWLIVITAAVAFLIIRG